MAKQTFKNLTDQELVVPNVGVFAPNGELTTDSKIENKKIQVVEKKGK